MTTNEKDETRTGESPEYVDPIAAARAWLAANPDHDVASHVQAALGSADRYERLSREAEAAKPGTTVVLVSPTGSTLMITSPERKTEQDIAAQISRLYRLDYAAGFEDGFTKAIAAGRRALNALVSA